MLHKIFCRDYQRPGRHDNDIALYELEEEIELIGSIGTICIPRGNFDLTQIALVGWGKRNCRNAGVFKGAHVCIPVLFEKLNLLATNYAEIHYGQS